MNLIRNFVTKIILIFSSIIFIFATLEICLRLFYDNGKVYEIEMLKYANYLKYQVKENGKFYFAHYPNKSKKIMGADIRIDEKGYRVISPSKKKYSKKILMIGDSMTMGFGSKETFTNLLNKNLDEYFFINAGVGNTNTLMQIDSFFSKDFKEKPNVVVLNFFINDLEKINFKKKTIKNYSYLLNIINYKLKLIALNKRKIDYISFYKNTFDDELQVDKTFSSIILLKDYCEKNNIKLLIHFIPDVRELEQNVFAKEFDLMEEFALRNNINFISGYDYFKNYNNLNFLVTKLDPHLNESGHKLIASYLIKYIK